MSADEAAPFLYPATYTPALSSDPAKFVSDGPMLRAFIAIAWRTPEHPNGIKLDVWQAWLIDRILERYPDDWPDRRLAGRLRYRQCVVSIPRQNGKSVLGAIFALYGLMFHEAGPVVVGVASSAEQARIVYNRVLFVIQSNPSLKKRFAKMTETRGIKTKDGSGTYEIKASKGAALQGIPTSLSIVDELHITAPAVWSALVQGTRTRRNGMVLGITTAGDEDSELLIRLYKLGMKACEPDTIESGKLQRFGFFLWQAPEAVIPEDDDALEAWLLASNPGAYEGRVEIADMITDVRAEPEQDVIRYVGNLFVASVATFLPPEKWAQNERGKPFPDPGLDGYSRARVSIDRTPDWGHASIHIGVTRYGITHVEVVASIVRPTIEILAEACVNLNASVPGGVELFAVDGYSLRDLGKELDRQGLNVHIGTQGDMLTASSLLYSRVIQRKIRHSGDELLRRQIPRAVRKNVGDGFRISRRDSSDIDAVIGTALLVLVCETTRDMGMQVF